MLFAPRTISVGLFYNIGAYLLHSRNASAKSARGLDIVTTIRYGLLPIRRLLYDEGVGFYNFRAYRPASTGTQKETKLVDR